MIPSTVQANSCADPRPYSLSASVQAKIGSMKGPHSSSASHQEQRSHAVLTREEASTYGLLQIPQLHLLIVSGVENSLAVHCRLGILQWVEHTASCVHRSQKRATSHGCTEGSTLNRGINASCSASHAVGAVVVDRIPAAHAPMSHLASVLHRNGGVHGGVTVGRPSQCE